MPGPDRAIERVVISRPDLSPETLLETADLWARRGAEVWLISDEIDVLRRAAGPSVGGVAALMFRPATVVRAAPVLKRVLDLAGAGLGLVLLSPLLILVALAVKLTSPGPILHRQVRVGRAGREFTFLKFRSMVEGASPTVHEAFVRKWVEGQPAATDAEGRKVFKLTNDPRITPLGRVLRRTSLDELPQLLNVVRGDMSLVGPRPCVPFELQFLKPWQRRRLDVMPGCTGLWQIAARSSVEFRDMVLLDLHYMANRSLAGDLGLILRTIPVMVLGRGGH